MTIARIEGGLGSQMMAYAAARRLALQHGLKVLLDARNYRYYKKFQVELHHFDIDAILLDDDQADEICGPDGSLDPQVPVVRPAHLHVDRTILDLPSGMVSMWGNYVSEDYFSDIEEVLRKDFRRVTEPVPYAVETAEMIRQVEQLGFEPVAVHVRRGDYVLEEHVRVAHGTCSPEYYRNAFRLVERAVDNPWYFIFSNDSDWTAQHFAGENRTVTRPPADAPPVEDMLLMAACRHHIIANSGYSWWGAWLGDNPGQVVVGPRPFMADRTLNTEDLMRRQWFTLGTQPRP